MPYQPSVAMNTQYAPVSQVKRPGSIIPMQIVPEGEHWCYGEALCRICQALRVQATKPLVPVPQDIPAFTVRLVYARTRERYEAYTAYKWRSFAGSGATADEACASLLEVLRRDWPGVSIRDLVVWEE